MKEYAELVDAAISGVSSATRDFNEGWSRSAVTDQALISIAASFAFLAAEMREERLENEDREARAMARPDLCYRCRPKESCDNCGGEL